MNKKKRNKRNRKKKQKLKKMRKLRNQVALAAIFHGGIHTFPDKKKENSKIKCRIKIKENENG